VSLDSQQIVRKGRVVTFTPLALLQCISTIYFRINHPQLRVHNSYNHHNLESAFSFFHGGIKCVFIFGICILYCKTVVNSFRHPAMSVYVNVSNYMQILYGDEESPGLLSTPGVYHRLGNNHGADQSYVSFSLVIAKAYVVKKRK